MLLSIGKISLQEFISFEMSLISVMHEINVLPRHYCGRAADVDSSE